MTAKKTAVEHEAEIKALANLTSSEESTKAWVINELDALREFERASELDCLIGRLQSVVDKLASELAGFRTQKKPRTSTTRNKAGVKNFKNATPEMMEQIGKVENWNMQDNLLQLRSNSSIASILIALEIDADLACGQCQETEFDLDNVRVWAASEMEERGIKSPG